MPPMTMADLLAAVSTDTAQIGTDQAAVTADQVKLEADQASVASDNATLSSDTTTFGNALALSGPFAQVSEDQQSVTIFTPGATAPDFSSSVIPVGSAVPIPTPPTSSGS